MTPTPNSSRSAIFSSRLVLSRMQVPATSSSVSVWPMPQTAPCQEMLRRPWLAADDARDGRDVVSLQRVLHAKQQSQPQNRQQHAGPRLDPRPVGGHADVRGQGTGGMEVSPAGAAADMAQF